MFPSPGLTQAEKAEIEKSRGELAEGVRMANKALGGVIEFSDWKKHASAILASAASEKTNTVDKGGGEEVGLLHIPINSYV
jgi:hypothetical protein